MLRAAGHPAVERLVTMTGNVGHSSATHYEGAPGLLLNRDHLHEHAVAHEVAHLIDQHQRGVEIGGHGVEWQQHFAGLLDEKSRRVWDGQK
jgi:predicted SprT family Zn-dependent metalloprotease